MMSHVRMAYQAPITPAGTTRPASAATGLRTLLGTSEEEGRRSREHQPFPACWPGKGEVPFLP